jgi:hypothetical protein
MKDISARILAIVVCQLFLLSISLYFGAPGEGKTPFITSTYLLEHFIMGKVGGPSEAHITFIAFSTYESKIALLTLFDHILLCL